MILIDNLPCARHCPMKCVLLLSSFYRWGTKGLNGLPKIAQVTELGGEPRQFTLNHHASSQNIYLSTPMVPSCLHVPGSVQALGGTDTKKHFCLSYQQHPLNSSSLHSACDSSSPLTPAYHSPSNIYVWMEAPPRTVGPPQWRRD